MKPFQKNSQVQIHCRKTLRHHTCTNRRTNQSLGINYLLILALTENPYAESNFQCNSQVSKHNLSVTISRPSYQSNKLLIELTHVLHTLQIITSESKFYNDLKIYKLKTNSNTNKSHRFNFPPHYICNRETQVYIH